MSDLFYRQPIFFKPEILDSWDLKEILMWVCNKFRDDEQDDLKERCQIINGYKIEQFDIHGAFYIDDRFPGLKNIVENMKKMESHPVRYWDLSISNNGVTDANMVAHLDLELLASVLKPFLQELMTTNTIILETPSASGGNGKNKTVDFTTQGRLDWIKCSDKLPNFYEKVLFLCYGNIYVGELSENGWDNGDDNLFPLFSVEEVTHWAELSFPKDN